MKRKTLDFDLSIPGPAIETAEMVHRFLARNKNGLFCPPAGGQTQEHHLVVVSPCIILLMYLSQGMTPMSLLTFSDYQLPLHIMSQINMKLLEPREIVGLRSLLLNHQFKPLRTLQRISPEKEAEYLLSLCSNVALEKKTGAVISADERGKSLGFLTFEELQWDTKVFDLPMAKIAQIVVAPEPNKPIDVYRRLLMSSLDCSRRRGIKHLSCQIDAQDVRGIIALQQLGFAMVDTIVVYSLDLNRWKGKELQIHTPIREYRPENLPALKTLARTAFSEPRENLNRFIADPYLPDDRCGKFYEEWLVNSCNGSMADVVLVAETNGEIVGFTTGKVHKQMSEMLGIRYASQPLSAVLATARHRGIYTDLAKALIGWMLNRADVCENKTQVTTVSIQRSYHRFGRTLVSSYHTFRKWLGETPLRTENE